MSELRQRVEPIRAKAIRRAAAGQRCALNLPGICNYDPSTVVLAHIHDEQFGRSQKADDTSGMFCCDACHRAYDLHLTGLDELTLLQLVFRAYQRTIRRLVLLGVLALDQDTPPARKIKPRKPEAERRAISHRVAPIPQRVKQPRRQQHSASRPLQRKGDTP